MCFLSPFVSVKLVIGGDRPIATWIYAVAAPFYTVTDIITIDDLLTAWQEGQLYLDQETSLALQALWGPPANQAALISAGYPAAVPCRMASNIRLV